MNERIAGCISGLVIAIIGAGFVFGCRGVARSMAVRERSSAFYTLADFLGTSDEHPWALYVGAIGTGLMLFLLGIYCAWNSLFWPSS